MTDQPIISIRSVTKSFGALAAVDDVSLDIMAGEFFVLLGPSGCGKTTLLRMIAGFETPDSGTIRLDGEEMAGIPPNKRPVNTVFQSYAVFPHMSVADNVGYGLAISGVGRCEIVARVAEALSLVKLEALGGRMPDQLSGGQRQRVALARSLIMRPKVLLLDEPLSALDAKLRKQMQFELSELQDEVGITFITVTHDQDEALSMATRIAVMDHGRIAQLAEPVSLYEQPANRFVAEFIGAVNIFEARLERVAGQKAALSCDELGPILASCGRTQPLKPGQTTWIALRPEKIIMTKKGAAAAKDQNCVFGTIKGLTYHGDITLYDVALASGTLIRVSRPNLSPKDLQDFTWDSEVTLSWAENGPVLLEG